VIKKIDLYLFNYKKIQMHKCEVCNFETKDKRNFEKHNKTIEHRIKNKEIIKFIVYGFYHNEIILYIGSSHDSERRLLEHKIRCFNVNFKDYNFKFYKYIRDKNLTFDILEHKILHTFTIDSKCKTKKEMLKEVHIQEQKFIDMLKPLCNQHKANTGLNIKDYHKQYSKQQYQDNKDEIKQKHKQYRSDNKDKIKQQKKQYCKQRYQDNKDEIKQKQKQWYQDNQPEIKQQKKQYYEDNKDEINKKINCNLCKKPICERGMKRHQKGTNCKQKQPPPQQPIIKKKVIIIKK
jgi:hypothetical protein